MNDFNEKNNIALPTENVNKSNSLGIASLVLGILSIILCCTGITIIISIIGLILSIMQMRKYNNGIAISGFVTSLVGIVLDSFGLMYLILCIIASFGY